MFFRGNVKTKAFKDLKRYIFLPNLAGEIAGAIEKLKGRKSFALRSPICGFIRVF